MIWFESHLLWLKAFHIIFVIAWMAGLFYLPRLFVYHVGVENQSDVAKTFQTMEYRLYRFIMMPAMILSLSSGVILAIIQDTWSSGWMHLKLLSIILLVVFHHLLNYWRKQLIEGTCQHHDKFFRIINEIPTLLLIVIVVSVVVKPF